MNKSYYWTRFKEYIELKNVKKEVLKYSHLEHTPDFFILSSGRSGSTLLRKMIVENSRTHIPPESGDLIVKTAKILFNKNNNSWPENVENVIKSIHELNINSYWNLDFAYIRSRLLALPESDRNYYSVIAEIYRFDMDNTTRLIGDKTPYLVLRSNWLQSIFPKAKYIYVLRDGRDVVASRMKAFNENLEHAAQRWLWSINELEKLSKSNAQLHVIRYEDLVSNPETHLDQILKFLKIDRTEPRPIMELGDDILSHHQNLSVPIFDKSIGNWKTQLSKDQINKLDNLFSNTHSKHYN